MSHKTLLKRIERLERASLGQRFTPIKSIGELLPQLRLNPGAQRTLLTEYLPLSQTHRHLPQTALWMRSGIGGGKSFAGAAFVVSRALLDPESRGLISANDYGQLETSTLVALAEFCESYRVPLSPTGTDPDSTARAIAARRSCKIGSAHILVLSAEKFTARTKSSQEAGRGLQIRYCWLDEYAYAKAGALDTILGRLGRGKGIVQSTALITSSINKNDPYNWCYQRFDAPDRSEAAKQTYLSIAGTTAENAAHLESGFIERLQAAYTPELFSIEVLSEYAAMVEGRIFKYFQRERHLLSVAPSPSHPIHLSIDFNHSPAGAIAAQFLDGEVRILKEWYILNSNTFELSEAIADWLSSLPVPNEVNLHGDATGNQKTANSRQTNWQIVRGTLSQRGWGVRIRYGQSNPGVSDSINSTNAAMRKDLVYLHPDCKELLIDVETLKYKDNGDIDKSDGMRSHLGDCLRYLVHDLIPLAVYRSHRVSRDIFVPPVGVF